MNTAVDTVIQTHDTSELASQYNVEGEKQFRQAMHLLSDLSIHPGERILDVGCGTGRLTHHIAEMVGATGKVVGLDPEIHRVKLAQQDAAANTTIYVGSAEKLEGVEDNSFDVVVFNSVFHWLRDHAAALKEVARVLRPGGRLGISTLSKDLSHDWRLILETALTPVQVAADDGTLLGPSNRIGQQPLADLLNATGFDLNSAQVRTSFDVFDNLNGVLSFHRTSSAGRFFGGIEETERDRLLASVKTEVDKYYKDGKIHFQRHLMYVVATKRA